MVRKVILNIAELPRPAKRLLVVLIDGTLAMFTVWLAFYLRLGEFSSIVGTQWIAVALALSVLPIFWAFGLYRAVVRYLGFDALILIGRGCLVFGILYATVFTFLGVAGVPRTVGLIQPILLFILVASSRAAARSLLVGLAPGRDRPRVLIYGAGASGRQLTAAILGSGEMDVVGFVDDDASLHGAVINGKRVFAPNGLSQIVERRRVSDILLAMPSASRKRRRDVVAGLLPLGVRVQTIPGLMDLASGRVQINALRQLEIEDLLGRDVAIPEELLLSKSILGKTVLVTGAGGSIGSELCRQILAVRPNTLLLVEMSEYALYSIDAELNRLLSPTAITKIVPLLASVCDEGRMRVILDAWRPDTVYHAAAYKHVPLVEHNPVEGVRNNVLGTMTMAQLAVSERISDFVLISTDKAVRPTNVMGTTKRVAELCLQTLSEQQATTRFSMVRFGNVLGSSGSVVPLFRQQIAAGGPVTITHQDVTRYFMTIPEAAQLVIQAGAMARGGEVFILDMGEPVKIADLARRMIELSGLSVRDTADPHGEIEIQVVGLRPGEKLYEELLIGENPIETIHPQIMKAQEPTLSIDELERQIGRLKRAVEDNDAALALEVLREVVPDFTPSDCLMDWVHLRRNA